MKDREEGALGFSNNYWEQNYGNPDEMDNIGNAKEHALYLKSLFQLDYIDVSSIIDYGAGLGVLFKEMLKAFIPYKTIGIEPSPYAFNILKKEKLTDISSMKIKLLNQDLKTFCLKNHSMKSFDLGICTSVFQYLSEDEIEICLPVMARQVKYLYFSVPTNKEFKRQVEDLDFKDEFAIHRSRSWYQKKIKKHFTFISARVLESRHFFSEETTHFTDLIFRF